MDQQTQTVIDLIGEVDHAHDRAMFFMELEIAELQAVIPKAEPIEAKQVY